MSIISKNIKLRQQEKGLLQDKLFKSDDLFLNTVIKIELENRTNPTIETVQQIAIALEVSADDFS